MGRNNRNDIQSIERLGEEKLNNFGSKMIIIKYDDATHIDVYFPEYNWTKKKCNYKEFKKGTLKCPYEPRTYGKGYLGEGEYKTIENGKRTKYYKTWQGMLERCYDTKFNEKHITYNDCEVEDYLLNFQSACELFDEIYYEVPGERMCLDKDILVKGNKIYSRQTCIFVPERINTLFVKCDASRGKYPIGVTYRKDINKFVAQCSDKGKLIRLGNYDTPEEAFVVYKRFKEKLIKEVGNEYYLKGLIPKKLYDALYRYEVEITD